jgi:nitrate/nitrite transporter NarK
MALHRVDSAENRIGNAYEWYRDRRVTFAKGVFAAGSIIGTAFVAFLLKLPFAKESGAVNVVPLIVFGASIIVATLVVGSILWRRLRPVTREYIDAINYFTSWKRRLE